VTLEPNESTGIRIEFDEPRQVSVTHLAPLTWRRRPTISMSSRSETIVHIDAAHRGLGTASCGPDTLPEYRLAPGTYRWRWILRGVRRA
jgi:beta-galactosidase